MHSDTIHRWLHTQNTMITVLLIDDEPAVCRALSRLLRFLGFQVLTAHSGAEAIQIADDTQLTSQGSLKIDIVLSDVQMTGMSGHDVAAAFADRCPVILMSGALEQQLNGVLAKPFTPTELLRHINRALHLAA